MIHYNCDIYAHNSLMLEKREKYLREVKESFGINKK